MSYNGVNATAVATTGISNNVTRVRLFYLLEADLPSAGTYSAALSAAPGNPVIGAVSYSGVNQAAPAVAINELGTDTVSTASLSPTTSGGLAVSIFCKNQLEALTPTSPASELFTEIQNTNQTTGMAELSTDATSDTFEWSSASSGAHSQQIGVWEAAAAGANEMSGTPSAQATDASGTMVAPASAAGTPQAGAATADGTLQHRSSSSGSPQAGAATADGAATVLDRLSGTSQAGAAVSAGTLLALATLSGAPQAGAAVGDGTAEALVQLSGDPQAGAAVGSGAVGGLAANASGSPEAGAATGAGTLKAIISAAGTPTASAATSTGLLQHRSNLAPPGFTLNDDTVNIEFSGAETVETIDVLANDVDPVTGDGSTLIIETITQPPAGQGSVAINPDGRRLDWTRPAGFVGTVQFTYTAVREYPVPRAGDATSEGLVSPNPNAAGDVEAGAATADGTIKIIVGLTGAPSAGAATSVGLVGVLVSMQGSPQAQPATGSGFIDDGSTPLVAARGRGLIVNVGEILRP